MQQKLKLEFWVLPMVRLAHVQLFSWFGVVRDPVWLFASMIGVGFSWASILSIPYAFISDSAPASKMGAYMGIFNLFIVMPQIVAASLLGRLLKFFFSQCLAAGRIAGWWSEPFGSRHSDHTNCRR